MQYWATAGVPNADPFGSWRDDLAMAFVRLEPQRVTDEPFAGRIDKAESGPVQVSRVDAGGHQVSRLKEHIAQAAADVVFVNLQISGIGLVGQHGSEIKTRPFDIAVVDTNAPFRIRHADRFSLFSIAAPRALVPAGLLKSGYLPLSADDRGRQISRMLTSYSQMSLSQGATPEINAVYGRHIVDLLAIAVEQLQGTGSGRRRESIRLSMLQDYIGQNYEDSRLSALRLSTVFGISERYVHKIFADAGTTLSDYVRDIRLRECASLLGATAARPRSIADIAFATGFGDISYFNRCFRSRFGETPSSYRRRLRER